LTSPYPLKTRETVETETRLSLATSLIVLVENLRKRFRSSHGTSLRARASSVETCLEIAHGCAVDSPRKRFRKGELMKGFRLERRAATAAAAAALVALALAAAGGAAPPAPGFYVPGPDPAAKQQIAALTIAGDTRDAALLSSLEATPRAVWIDGGTPNQARV